MDIRQDNNGYIDMGIIRRVIMSDDKYQLFRCKCGKLYGSKNHLRICKRCKDKVIARKDS